MYDVNNDVIPSQLKDFLIPTANIHSYNTRYSVPTTSILKKKLEIERKSFSRIGAKLWNEIPTNLRTLPKLIFTEKENSYDLVQYIRIKRLLLTTYLSCQLKLVIQLFL